MFRWLGGLLVAAVVSTPIAAQELAPFAGPTPTPAASRVLVDIVSRVLPLSGAGHCLRLPAGTLAITARWASEVETPGVEFTMFNDRGADPGATQRFVVPGTVTVPITGASVYCYSLDSLASVPPNASLVERSQYVQYVALQMTVTPSH